MDHVAEGTTLSFVSDDKDYCSPLDDEDFNRFLLDEWCQKKLGKLVFYKRLSAPFRDHFPDIKLASELEKDLLIAGLGNSGNFATTHALVAKLSKYSDFTPAQASAIANAAVNNSQVRWIVSDGEVHNFLDSIVSNNEKHVEPETIEALKGLLDAPAAREASDQTKEV